MWRLMQLRFFELAAFAVSLFLASGAAAEVFFSDARLEISGAGARSSRNCTIAFIPAQTHGGALAPRLAFITDGMNRLSFGVENEAQFANAVFVQNNSRVAFGTSKAGTQQFLTSEMGKMLRSQQLFFVTAKRSDSGKYVSSRYDNVDFDGLLRVIEQHCPFDAESMMSDATTSARERAEQALRLSDSDLKLIRWALNKRYSGSSGEPEGRSSLTLVERNYLRQYAAAIGLPASRYLTNDTANRLRAEGSTLAALAPPPTPSERWNSVAGAVWKVRGRVRVAIGYSGIVSSESEALAIAVRQCRSAGGPNCKATGAWSSGCVYITVGSNTRGAGWNSSADYDETLRKCRASGYNCKPPIGGCIN